MKLAIGAHTVLLFEAHGFARLNVDSVVVAGAFGHGHAGAFIIQVHPLWAGAAIHRQEVRGAAVLLRVQLFARPLAALQLVGEALTFRAAPCVFITDVHSPAAQENSLRSASSGVGGENGTHAGFGLATVTGGVDASLVVHFRIDHCMTLCKCAGRTC